MRLDQVHELLQKAASLGGSDDPSSGSGAGSGRRSDGGAQGDAQRSFVAAVARAALQQQACICFRDSSGVSVDQGGTLCCGNRQVLMFGPG